MNAPICDFVKKYNKAECIRMHMPGHKGNNILGFEALDLTEISGADSLYEADGIIAESEKNASALFDCPTFYSTEGSSQCIKAMLMLAGRIVGKKSVKVLAGRNAHKTFISAAALLDVDAEFICDYGIEALKEAIERFGPDALYLTSPDYLGNMLDMEALAKLCHQKDVLLMVDNAHGAYLKFMGVGIYPMELGADMCCDSAHKTLPVLTGGAYLHVSKAVMDAYRKRTGFELEVKEALEMFGSTSPSYLILQSLDAANVYIAEALAGDLKRVSSKLEEVKSELTAAGFELMGAERMKLTIKTKSFGYRGDEFAEELRIRGVECEFADPDFVVLMPSCKTGDEELDRLKNVLFSVERKDAAVAEAPDFYVPEGRMSIKEAYFSEREKLHVQDARGRICSHAHAGCPPAIPIVVSGELIDDEVIKRLKYYGVEELFVVK